MYPYLSMRNEIWAGKSLGRILFNQAVQRHCAGLSGNILDIAGGVEPSYLRFLPSGITLVRTNRAESDGVSQVDFNKPLPYDDSSFDAVLLFNALYIAEDPEALMREIYRILKPGGSAYVTSPLIANEMPEPHDYMRLTAEGLERVGRNAGFPNVEIYRIGERGSAAVSALQPFLMLPVRFAAYPAALWIDRMVPTRIRRDHPMPVLYFVQFSKCGR